LKWKKVFGQAGLSPTVSSPAAAKIDQFRDTVVHTFVEISWRASPTSNALQEQANRIQRFKFDVIFVFNCSKAECPRCYFYERKHGKDPLDSLLGSAEMAQIEI
jgi:hypothetical protein